MKHVLIQKWVEHYVGPNYVEEEALARESGASVKIVNETDLESYGLVAPFYVVKGYSPARASVNGGPSRECDFEGTEPVCVEFAIGQSDEHIRAAKPDGCNGCRIVNRAKYRDGTVVKWQYMVQFGTVTFKE